MHDNKVMVIGLDGLAPGLVKSWVEHGHLPTFARISKEGVTGRLRSTIPPASPPAWTSAVTGVNPGKHGIFEFVHYDGYTRRPVDSTRRKSKAVWQILSEKGRRVGVMNVPMTFPPERVNGFMVSGLMAGLDAEFTYPKSLKHDLLQRAYKIDVTYEKWASVAIKLDHANQSAVEDVWEADERRKDVMLYLMDRFDWDFFMTVFVSPDRVQHMFWRDFNGSSIDDVAEAGYLVRATYQKLDAILGKILASIDSDTNVIIVSDHGFGPIHSSVRLNNWFQNQGMLRVARSARGILRSLGFTEVNLVAAARRLMGPARLGRTVENRERALRRLRHSGLIPRLHLATFEDFDWNRTKACYVFGDAIRVNLKGREPKGIVPPGVEFEQLLNQINRDLLDAVDPNTGQRFIRAVHRPEHLYKGEYFTDSGDLIIEMADGYMADEYVGESLVVPSTERAGPKLLGPSGQHRIEGVISALGPDIQNGCEIRGAQIVDITPTILYLMKLPIPGQMDGRVLSEALKPDVIEKTPIRYEAAEAEAAEAQAPAKDVFTPEQTKIVEDRLRALGYLS